MTKMTLSEELKWRGFVNQTTMADLSVLDKHKRAFYHGYDASSDSQTIGNLAAMMFDRLFMRHGYKGVILAGGATSLIGDPGGKDAERVLQDERTIAHNVACAEVQLKKVLSGYKFRMVNNLDWTRDLKVIDYLRDIGKHFSMTPLVQRDYIAKRIGEKGSGISYTEFSYTILQGLDYLYLFDHYDVTLQLGGSDQWGNCLSGVELVRRARGAEVDVITLPLIINKATGKKFGKSEEGAIWLDPDKTSVYKFYQFWLNMDDEGVEYYLKIYTELDKDQIDDVMDKFKKDKSSRLAQKTLAHEVTKLVHGEANLKAVERVNQTLFGEREYRDLSKDDFAMLERELPVVKAKTHDLAPLLVEAGLANSNTEARQFIGSGAIYINGNKNPEMDTSINSSQAIHGYIVLRRGKNNTALVKL